jgi:hypothetical protein
MRIKAPHSGPKALCPDSDAQYWRDVLARRTGAIARSREVAPLRASRDEPKNFHTASGGLAASASDRALGPRVRVSMLIRHLLRDPFRR